MSWAVLLWFSKMVTPTVNTYDPEVHLCYGDMQIHSHTNPCNILQVQIKASKIEYSGRE